MKSAAGSVAYVFLDEGGNFDFSPNGSTFFTMSALSVYRPFPETLISKMSQLRCDLLEQGIDIEYFHATEDKQATRNEVFKILKENVEHYRVDSVIVEKRKTNPSIRDDDKFYPMVFRHLMAYVFNNLEIKNASQIVVVTDHLPVQKKRKAIVKGVKTGMHEHLGSETIPYRIQHHQSKAWWGLQAVDYFNWAILRKWKDDDYRSYRLVSDAIKSEFDIFQNGTIMYY